MSLQLPFGVHVLNPLPLDYYYYKDDVPYIDKDEVNTTIESAFRYQGLTVNVAGVECWYKDGIDDSDLKEKLSSAILSHSALEDLTTSDDHTQYFNETRGDARYYPQTTLDTTFGFSGASAGEVAYLNSTTDGLDYSSDFVYDGTTLLISAESDENAIVINGPLFSGNPKLAFLEGGSVELANLKIVSSEHLRLDAVEGGNIQLYPSGGGGCQLYYGTSQKLATVTTGVKVEGTLETDTIKITTGATNGYFLKSDADGNGSWAALSASQTYLGTWDADTNTPTLTNSTGTAGDYYRVTVAGTQDLGSGDITFSIGDDVSYDGSVWERIPAATVTGNPLTKTDDTNVTLTLGGSPTTALVNAASITVGWTGTLADSRIASASNWNEAWGWGDHSTEGYLTEYIVTESDVTAHEDALTITESQISDLGSYSLTTHDHDSDYAALGHDHSGVYEPVLDNPASNGYILSSTTGGTRSWIDPDTIGGTTFSFGDAGEIPYVNSGTDDFDYSSNLIYDGTTLKITSSSNSLQIGRSTVGYTDIKARAGISSGYGAYGLRIQTTSNDWTTANDNLFLEKNGATYVGDITTKGTTKDFLYYGSRKVGINTDSPTGTFHVRSSGDTWVYVDSGTTSTDAGIVFRENTSTRGLLGWDDSSGGLKLQYATSAVFDNYPAIFIGSNNNVCLGGTLSGSTYRLYIQGKTKVTDDINRTFTTNSQSLLDVDGVNWNSNLWKIGNGSSRAYGFRLEYHGSGNNNSLRLYSSDASGVSPNTLIQETFQSGNKRFYGTLTATDFALPSDPRLKDVESPVTNGLEIVEKLKPVNYKWKDKRDNYSHIGFLTTDVEEIRPELVSKGEETDALSYMRIAAINTAAIKELKVQVEELQKQIKELQNANSR